MSAVLGYEPVPENEFAERVWVDACGSHRVAAACKDELLAAVRDLRPRKGARLVLLGTDVVGELPEAERLRLLSRVGYVAADGGLISSLNAWENISLPVAYHAPARMAGVLAQVRALLDELGGVDDLLGKLPENMTLYEKRLTAFVRALLESPELLVVENLAAGLGPTKRRRVARFAGVYQARCPGATYVQLEELRGES